MVGQKRCQIEWGEKNLRERLSVWSFRKLKKLNMREIHLRSILLYKGHSVAIWQFYFFIIKIMINDHLYQSVNVLARGKHNFLAKSVTKIKLFMVTISYIRPSTYHLKLKLYLHTYRFIYVIMFFNMIFIHIISILNETV